MKKQSVLSFLRNLTEAVEKDAEELEEKVRKICKEADEEEVEVEEAEDEEEIEVDVEEAKNDDILQNQEDYPDIEVIKEVFRRVRTDIDELDSSVYGLFGDIIVPFDNLHNDDGTIDDELDNVTNELYDIAYTAWTKLREFFEKHQDLMKKLGLNESKEEVEEAEDDEEDIELDVEESEDEEEVEETSKKAKVPTKVKESVKHKKAKKIK